MCRKFSRHIPCAPVSQRSHYTARRKQIWGALHPVAAPVRADEIQVEQLVPPEFSTGYKQPPPQEQGFAAATAAVTGESKQSINRRIARAEATAAPSRSAMPAADLSPVYGPEGKEGEGVQQRGKSAFACVANFAQVREETSRVNVLNVLMSCFLLKFSAKRGVLGHLAGHGKFGAGEHLRASTAADAHRRKMCGENFLHIIRNTACTAVRRSDTVVPKPKGPVLQNTFGRAVATPTESGVLSRPDFLGVSTFGRAYGFGRGGVCPQGWPHGSSRVLNRHVHPLCFKTHWVALKSRRGAKTMTASPVASRSAAPTTPHLDPIQLHVEAVNAASMARWYAARHDYAAAFRKSAQATGALRRLASFERMGTAVQGA